MPSTYPIEVVTGASSGIGAATARRLATEGFHVVAVARRAQRLETLAKEITTGGGAATAVVADITRAADVAELRDTVEGLTGELTLLVNNAGGARGSQPVETADVADWQGVDAVNLLGSVPVTPAVLAAL